MPSGRGHPPHQFSLNFLANPYKLWVSELFEDKRTVLQLAFQENLAYVRGEGFRTAHLAAPFKLSNTLPNSTVSSEGMVELSGFEPLASSLRTRRSTN
jgi:site-specific DNA recombinase